MSHGVDALVSIYIQSIDLEFKTCPIKNGTIIRYSNFTEKEEVAQMLSVPPGNYRSTFLLYDDIDEQIAYQRLKYYIKATSTEGYEFK